MRKPLCIGLILGLLTVAGSAAAQYPPPPPPPAGYGGGYGGYAPRPVQTFGGPGTLAISSDMNLALQGCSGCASPVTLGYGPLGNTANSSGWLFTLAPAADYFVIQGLSIGAQIAYTHVHTNLSTGTGSSSSTTADTDLFGIGARVGYNIPIMDLLSWWPKVGIVFTNVSTTGNLSGNTFDLQLYAPLLLHLAPHFFAGLGPNLQTDLSASASASGVSAPSVPKATSYGLLFTIGGWTVPGG